MCNTCEKNRVDIFFYHCQLVESIGKLRKPSTLYMSWPATRVTLCTHVSSNPGGFTTVLHIYNIRVRHCQKHAVDGRVRIFCYAHMKIGNGKKLNSHWLNIIIIIIFRYYIGFMILCKKEKKMIYLRIFC